MYTHPEHEKYEELEDVLVPSLNRAVGLARALVIVHDFLGGDDPRDLEGMYRGIRQRYEEYYRHSRPGHHADIACTLLAVQEFLERTPVVYVADTANKEVVEQVPGFRPVLVEAYRLPLVRVAGEIEQAFHTQLQFGIKRVKNRVDRPGK